MGSLRGKFALQNWAVMALASLFALFLAPTLAFACCCHSKPAAVSRSVLAHSAPSRSEVPVAASPGVEDCCVEEGHFSPTLQKTGAEAEQGIKGTAAVPAVSAPCQCPQTAAPVIPFTETQQGSAFSASVLSAASPAFVLMVKSDSRLAHFLTSPALQPRPPTGASCSGRAPPVFSL